MEAIISSSVKRNIAVVASTAGLPPGATAEPGSAAWAEIEKMIPFFGILNGLAFIGHTVRVVDHTIGAGSIDAEIVIIDSAVADRVRMEAIRASAVFIHDRATFALRPAAPEPLTWTTVFEKARGFATRGQIVLIQPDRSLLRLPCIPRQALTSDQLAQAHRLIPEGPPRHVVAIASTLLAPDSAGGTSAGVARLRAAGTVIPFFGLLLTLASAGNPVWIFEPDADAVESGCHGADLLLIDGLFADRLTMRSLDRVAGVMRSANIAVYDRGSKKMGLIRHVGPSKDALEFRN